MQMTKIYGARVKYQGLKKGDKHKFLQYMCERYGSSPFTLSDKLRKGCRGDLNAIEAEVLDRVLGNEEWKAGDNGSSEEEMPGM